MFAIGNILALKALSKWIGYISIPDQRGLIGLSGPVHHMAPEPRCSEVSYNAIKMKKDMDMRHKVKA